MRNQMTASMILTTLRLMTSFSTQKNLRLIQKAKKKWTLLIDGKTLEGRFWRVNSWFRLKVLNVETYVVSRYAISSQFVGISLEIKTTYVSFTNSFFFSINLRTFEQTTYTVTEYRYYNKMKKLKLQILFLDFGRNCIFQSLLVQNISTEVFFCIFI